VKQFGLIGYPLSHSWSETFFTEKFRGAGLADYSYHLFPLPRLDEFPRFMNSHPGLNGFNVTIPYKERIIPFLDKLDRKAEEIGAVNTVIVRQEKTKKTLIGFNTDADGFIRSADFSGYSKALVLGTGGASRAVCYALRSLGISPVLVSRKPMESGVISYSDINLKLLTEVFLIINTTPCGMYPRIGTFPAIPYQYLSPRHSLYDLIYNPAETLFLKKGAEYGAKIQSGIAMLQCQGEIAFSLFIKAGSSTFICGIKEKD